MTGWNAGIEVGQFTNYTLSADITNSTGTHHAEMFYRYTVIAVTSTNVTYNVTSGATTQDGQFSQYSFEHTTNSTLFSGIISLDQPSTGTMVTHVGIESISTTWGVKVCQKYYMNESLAGGTTIGNGTVWVYNDVLLKSESKIITTGDEAQQINETILLTQTNLPGISLPTPTASLSYMKAADGNYTFTLQAISDSNVLNNSVSIEITPLGPIASGWLVPTQYLGTGDYFTISGLATGGSYTVTLRYNLNDGVISTATFTA